MEHLNIRLCRDSPAALVGESVKYTVMGEGCIIKREAGPLVPC